ncbi:ABC transporter ATP-binding protein [Vibrio mimicus]|uniref:ABC transporter ATP-binding protein n=1 Tax=Vibrio mimicus TaxID=674 RepID=UPI0011D7249F|nr:ABC transporter ATP-binding protein [Vibrio mimicus]TXZ75236.1 ABC transporter ATP-binding protein [Vibrio mimicus]
MDQDPRSLQQNQAAPLRSDWQSLARLWNLAGPLKIQIAKGIFFRFVQSFCLGMAYGIAIMVMTNLIKEDFSPSRQWLVETVVLSLIALAGQTLFSFLAAKQTWFTSYQLAGDFRQKMLEHLKNLPLGFHLSRHRGDNVTTLTTDVQMVESFLSDGLPRIAEALGLPVAVLTFLLYQDIYLFLAGIFTVVLSLPVYFLGSRYMAMLSIERQDKQAEAAAKMLEYVQGLIVIKAFNRIHQGKEEFRAALTQFRDISQKMIKRLVIPFIAFCMLTMLGVPFMIFVDSTLLFSNEIELATFVTVLMLIYALYTPLLGLTEVLEQTRMADASLTRVDRIFTQVPLPEASQPEQPRCFDIRFDQVTFGYTKKEPVLNQLSFQARENTMTAIVGPSGAGKSTALNLIARFWDPDQGSVRIGEVDIRNIAPEELNRLITVVFQEVFLFSGTILDNLMMGKDDATLAEVEKAARLAQAHDFITALPDGYQTFVGEGGSTLSGGERQRLAVARAILKDAPIVIMDEATAAIDPTNERAFQSALSALIAKKTVIVVAHKLSTIMNASRILVLDEGCLVEQGSHDELLKQNGLYFRLWQNWTRAAHWHLG